MKVKKAKNALYIKSGYFSAQQILTSGQVFRFCPYKEGFMLNAGNEFAHITTFGDETHIYCTDENYFYNYFDLDTDYEQITKKLNGYPLMEEAVQYGKGIRILKQQKTETIFSFIISANNNIKRISGIIENICRELGEKKDFGGTEYYTFPTIDKLAQAGEDFYLKAGAGYRAQYLNDTANAIVNGFDIESIQYMDSTQAEKTLMKLKGIGKKVADCILLFAYGKTDVFPTDTWIEKVYCSDLKGEKLCREGISRYLADIYKDLSGYAQQYLFFSKKENKQKK